MGLITAALHIKSSKHQKKELLLLFSLHNEIERKQFEKLFQNCFETVYPVSFRCAESFRSMTNSIFYDIAVES